MKTFPSRGILSLFERKQLRFRVLIGVFYGVAILLTLVMFYPLAWVIASALKDANEVYASAQTLIPSQPHWENFAISWATYQLGPTMLNTFFLFAGVLLMKLGVLTLAAYALAHLPVPARKAVFLVFLSTLLLPTVAFLIPSFLAIVSVPLLGINLLDTYWALWIPAAADSFSLLMLKNFFDAIPRDLMEASRIDGAGEVTILSRVILPLSKPILAVLGIFTFLGVWNEFFWTRLIITTPDRWPVSVSLWYYSTVVGAQPPANVQLAAMSLAILPPLILFLFFQKYITQGVAFSGIKG